MMSTAFPTPTTQRQNIAIVPLDYNNRLFVEYLAYKYSDKQTETNWPLAHIRGISE